MRDDAVRFRKDYIAMGYTDLRSGIDRLATLVKKKFDLDPFQKDVLFLFCGRRKDRFKGIVWRGDLSADLQTDRKRLRTVAPGQR